MNNLKKYTLLAALVLPTFFMASTNAEAARVSVDTEKAKEVNVTKEAKTSSKVLGKITADKEYKITGVNGDFLEIKFDGKKGFVETEKVKQYEDTLVISPANFRKEPSLDSEIYEVLDENIYVTVIDVLDNGFVKVKYKETEGYISLDLLQIYEDILKAQEEIIAQSNYYNNSYNNNYYSDNSNYNNYSYQDTSYNYSNESSYSSNGQVFSASTSGIYSYAAQFVGNSYVWGGNSLTNGTDCSGFTQSVYSNYGVSLPHSSQAQYNYGTSVNVNDAKEGDLVFYGSSENNITHVAIADGKGGIVHAANESTGITTSSIGNPLGVKRVTEEETTTQSTKTSEKTSETTEPEENN